MWYSSSAFNICLFIHYIAGYLRLHPTEGEPVRILGIHDGHNSSVCLIEDGRIVHAVQEERFTYVKNQGGLPTHAIESVDRMYGLGSIDGFAFSGLYLGTYDWSRENVIRYYGTSDSWMNRIRQSLKKNQLVFRMYRKQMNDRRAALIADQLPLDKVQYLDHHLCHASAAYHGAGDYGRKVLVITADGEGDERAGSVYLGQDGKLTEIVSLRREHSLGRLYSYMTFLFNMVPYEHEYKIMGLAPYCTDRKNIDRCKQSLSSILRFVDDHALTWSYCGTYASIQAAGKEIKRIFAAHRFDVLAGALQEFTEDLLIEWIRRLIERTGVRDLVLSGGVFMNVKANMLIAKLSEVGSVFVFPSCGDESNAIGAAYHAYAERSGKLPVALDGFYLGEQLTVNEDDLRRALPGGIDVQRYGNIEERVAELLAQGEIVGRIKGPMEFGARALGNRSILANPSVDGVLRTINEMIKGRDFWMPFAPSVLAEDVSRYFAVDRTVRNYEYMIFTAESLKEKRAYARNALHPYDHTGRPQAVKREHNPDYVRLLEHYKKLTGESLILNTSYNLHGFPMVRTQEQALHVFTHSGLPHLALGDLLLSKTARP